MKIYCWVTVVALAAAVFAGCSRMPDVITLDDGKVYYVKTKAGLVLEVQAAGSDFSVSLIERPNTLPSFILIRQGEDRTSTFTTFEKDGGEVVLRDNNADGIPEVRMIKSGSAPNYKVEKLHFSTSDQKPAIDAN